MTGPFVTELEIFKSAASALGVECDESGDEKERHELDQGDYDSFFLHHLQSVKGDAAWYLNHRFVGKGGNGTTFFVSCTSGGHQGFQFALKVFHKVSDDKRRERFLDEIPVLSHAVASLDRKSVR